MKCEFKYCKNEARKNLRYCSNPCIKLNWKLKKVPSSLVYLRHKKRFAASQSGVGLLWEARVAKLLGAEHRALKKGADLIWNGKLVDVKACEIHRRKFKRGKPDKARTAGWVFQRGKDKPMDFFFCIALDGGKVNRMFLIPNSDFPKSGITIGKVSKYDRFIYAA